MGFILGVVGGWLTMGSFIALFCTTDEGLKFLSGVANSIKDLVD